MDYFFHVHSSNNLLEKLPSSLACLRNLTHLELSGNRLTELPDNIGRLTRLTQLNVSNNMITHLPDSMGSLRKLTVLLLNDNQLSDLPKSLGDLKLLTTLDISRNQVRIVPAELARLQYLRYVRVDGCPMMLEYAPEPKHDPPSLLELAARTIVRNEINVPSHVRDDIKEYISSASKCTHCGGPFFMSHVRRVKLVEKAEQTMIPMEYDLCSAHWNDNNGRIIAMFASKAATSKKPAHVLRAEKATRPTSSEQQLDLRTPRNRNQPRRRNTTSETLGRAPTLLASPIPASPVPSSMMSDTFDVPERTASPASMISNSATISISSLARKMYTSSSSSMSQMDTVLSASSSGSSTPEIAPATLPTRWRTQKVRNRSNTGFLSLSKLQRATSFSSIPSSQGIAI
jgi:Leucine rich repeat